MFVFPLSVLYLLKTQFIEIYVDEHKLSWLKYNAEFQPYDLLVFTIYFCYRYYYYYYFFIIIVQVLVIEFRRDAN